ncbi:MAG: hypothetical protein MJE77_16535 [Proteobacteria bacterium]|nr:hypothetical protein [Pseudomonadota bacterium]
MDRELVSAIMEDYTRAPIDERLRAILGFLRKLTLEPESANADDIAALRSVGLSDRAIREAMHVCFAFNVMDRLADAFDYDVGDAKHHRRCAQMLRRLGYRIGSLPG